MIDRFLRVLASIEKATACVLLAVLLVAVVVQVISRYVFQSPLSWTDEVSRFLLVWLTFVAAGYVMADRAHVSVDIAVAKLRIGTLAVVDTIATLVVVAGSAVLAVAGVALARNTADVSASATGLPMPVVYLAGVVGFTLIAAHGIGTIANNIRDPKSVPGALETLEKEGL